MSARRRSTVASDKSDAARRATLRTDPPCVSSPSSIADTSLEDALAHTCEHTARRSAWTVDFGPVCEGTWLMFAGQIR